MKTTKLTSFLTACALCLAAGVYAQSPLFMETELNLDDVDTLLEDNNLDEASSRYVSCIMSSFPERATRLGNTASNLLLNPRSSQGNSDAAAALNNVNDSLHTINAKQLSPAKRVEYDLVEKALETDLWKVSQNPINTDPLYYAQALDSLYDIILSPASSALRKRLDLESRLNALPTVAAQAKANLTQVSPYLAQLAMEKAYYAYLSFDELHNFLVADAKDEDTSSRLHKTSHTAKSAIRQMFDTFKTLSQKENMQDFRLGEYNYTNLLKLRYQIEDKPLKLTQKIEDNIKVAQQNLTQALSPFFQDTADEEVTVLSDEANAEPTTQKVEKAKKGKKKNEQLRSGKDFYNVANQLPTLPLPEKPLEELQKQAALLHMRLMDLSILPISHIYFKVGMLPQYYSYQQPFLFVPPYGNPAQPQGVFYVRIPSGNALSQKAQIARDFNAPTLKLMLAGELVPGSYYQNLMQHQKITAATRLLYPSATLTNGWKSYAKRLAKKHGFISSNEDVLYLAWDEFLHALAAWADVKLNLRQLAYNDVLSALTQTYGVEQNTAELMLKQIAMHPGEAVSYLYGLSTLEAAHDKYSRKYGKKFNEADFNNKLFQIGNVNPASLDKELTRLYKKHK